MPGLSKKKRFLLGLITVIAIGVTFSLVSHFNLLYGVQLRSNDFVFQAADLYQSAEPAEEIVVVGIDDYSLEQLGHFSLWPRSYHAQLIDRLAADKARVIVFDVLFAEPALADETLATSIKDAGNVILPVIQRQTADDARIKGMTQPTSFIRPLKMLEEGAIALGHANVIPDADGTVRRLPVALGDDDKRTPALALAAVAKYLRRPEVLESPAGDKVIPLAGRLIPINGNREMIINYIGNPNGTGAIAEFQTVSFADVLDGKIEPSVFQDKIVFIGATATGLGDTFWTPMGRMLNGVEIHASAAHTILRGNFLKPAPSSVTFTSILVLAILCGLAVLRFSVRWATLLAVSLGIAYFIIAFSVFDQGIVLNILYPSLAIPGVFVGINLYNISSERAEKRTLTKTFGRYVSPQVADKILVSLGKGELKLGGEEHEVTVAFADIRGFTSLSESIPPRELFQALNTHLSVVVKAILEYGGMINKFGGDSVMAIWNVPVKAGEHALLATKAAVSAQRAIRELQANDTTLPRMEFGIGINTGKAMAGNTGSEDRLEYSVIGDAVNTASRISSATPGGKVWISGDTFTQVKDYILERQLDPLVIKGKRELVEAYEVVGIRGSLTDDPREKTQWQAEKV